PVWSKCQNCLMCMTHSYRQWNSLCKSCVSRDDGFLPGIGKEMHFSYLDPNKGRGPGRRPFPTQSTSVGPGGGALGWCRIHFVPPGLLDAVDDVLRHRDVIEVLGHLGTLVVGPGEELERLGSGPRILRFLIH